MLPRRVPGRMPNSDRKSASKSGSAPKSETSEEPAEVTDDENNSNDSEGETGTQSSALDKILARFDTLEDEIKSVKTTVDEGIRAQEFNAKQAEDKLENHIKDCTSTKREIKLIGNEADGLKARVDYQGFRLTDLEEKIEQLERDSRRNVMIIEGVNEEDGISSPEIVDDLLQDLKLDFDSHVCDRVHRRGKAQTGTSAIAAEQTGNARKGHNRPRPIVVSFMRPIEKGKVFTNLNKLKGNERWKNVYFSDDYTERQKNEIRDLRALAAYAKSVGRDAAVKNHHIWVDGRRYRYEDIGKLAPDLTLEKAKTLDVLNGEGIAFQSKHSPLSNLYPCNVIHRGERYISSEAALHHTRAVVCKRPKEAHDILQARDPYKVKSIGASFTASREWFEIEDSELDDILYDKFTRNHYCRNFLLATGQKKLYEATGDRKWACGIPLSKISSLTKNQPGENRMGKKLESARDKIRALSSTAAKN